jgi:hypothetical protein
MPIEIKYILLEMLAPGLIFITEVLSTEVWKYCRFKCYQIHLSIFMTEAVVID